jgi:hypothetical protein
MRHHGVAVAKSSAGTNPAHALGGLGARLESLEKPYAPVAQLDRAVAF